MPVTSHSSLCHTLSYFNKSRPFDRFSGYAVQCHPDPKLGIHTLGIDRTTYVWFYPYKLSIVIQFALKKSCVCHKLLVPVIQYEIYLIILEFITVIILRGEDMNNLYFIDTHTQAGYTQPFRK